MSTPSTPDRPYPVGEPPVEQTLTLGEQLFEPNRDAPDGPARTTETDTTTEAPAASEAPTASQAGIAPGPDPDPESAVRRGIRMRTVVFGLVLLAIAGSVLVAQLTDITIDAGAVFLALMIGCGVLLIAGARRS
jgi:hypothetical protein